MATSPEKPSRKPLAALVVAVALAAAAVAVTIVVVRGSPPPATLQDRVRAVASGLRCPVCQDLSVADSPSALAREMRGKIGTELKAGASPDAIRAQFVDAYGDWILMSPPRHGISLVAWILPALLLGAGVVIGVLTVTRWTRGGRAEGSLPPTASLGDDLGPADRRLLDRALAAHGEEDE